MKPTQSPAAPRANWSGNHVFQAAVLHRPRSLTELQQLVARSQRLRALGSGHSFNAIADSEAGDQVWLGHLNSIAIDTATSTVTVGGGVTYAQLAPYLQQHGYALHNLASLPHISVAGAVQTGTHGSGLANGSLATAVTGMQLVAATGDLIELSRATHGERFDGMVVALGALGIVASLTLKIQPAYRVRQRVYERLPFAALAGNLRQVFASGYSVSLFTDWQSREAAQVWVKSRAGESLNDPLADIFGIRTATRELHPLPGHNADNCTAQMGVAGPWHERLPHFRSEFRPSSGNELQTEYFVPIDQGYAAIEAVASLGARIAPLLFVSELRTVAADGFWLSPCCRRQSLALHFTWKPDWPKVRELLPVIEDALAPFGARPHWAKMFTMAPERVQTLYPQLPQAQKLMQEFDPGGKFRNQFIDRYLL